MWYNYLHKLTVNKKYILGSARMYEKYMFGLFFYSKKEVFMYYNLRKKEVKCL